MDNVTAAPVAGAAAASNDVAAAPESNANTSLADALRTHFAGDAPLKEKAMSFAKARPWTSAAFVGVAAVALLNTLRGRG